MTRFHKPVIHSSFWKSIGICKVRTWAWVLLLNCAAVSWLYFKGLEPTTTHTAEIREQSMLRVPVAKQLSHNYTTVLSKTDPPMTVSVYTEGDIVSNNIKRHGYWDGGLTEVVSAILDARQQHSSVHTQPQTIVDFGANVGWFSLLAAAKGHRSIAVEPMSSNRGALFQSMALNKFDDSIRVVAAALGDGSPDSPGSLCIQPRVAGHNIGNGQTTTEVDGCGEVVPVKTLGSIIGNEQVDFVKADCEGCEANAIMGMKDIIAGKSPPCSLAIEWRTEVMKELGGDPTAVTKLLFESGYLFFRQNCDLVTGEGLKLTEIPSLEVPEKLPSTNMDLVVLHDSKRCFERDGKAFRFVMDRVASFQPLL